MGEDVGKGDSDDVGLLFQVAVQSFYPTDFFWISALAIRFSFASSFVKVMPMILFIELN